MANNQTTPRRSDVIRCENCGEDYSVTYKRCPFCDERPGRGGRPAPGGRRAAGGRRDVGGSQPVNPVQLAMLIGSVILIIAALFIVFKSLAPLFNKDGPAAPVSSSQSAPGASSVQPGSQSGGSASSAPGSSSGSVSTPEPSAPAPTGLSLSRSDFTLTAGETYQLTAAVTPAGVTEKVVYTSSDPSIFTVDEYGNVTNVNQTANQLSATLTATCGSQSAQCIVRCNGAAGSSTPTPSGGGAPAPDPQPSGSLSAGSVGYITGAAGGLNIRSGPGTSHSVQASTTNGAQITVLEDAGNGWYKIRYSTSGGGTAEGYVSKDYVSATK